MSAADVAAIVVVAAVVVGLALVAWWALVTALLFVAVAVSIGHLLWRWVTRDEPG